MWTRSLGLFLCAVILLCLTLVTVSDAHGRQSKDGRRRCHCSKRAPHMKRMREIRRISVQDCGESTSVVRLSSMNTYPDPVIVPGTMFSTFSFNLTSDLPQLLQVDVSMHKYVFGIPFTLPCLPTTHQWVKNGITRDYELRLGSCSYRDVCQLLDSSSCPNAMEQSGIPCNCTQLRKGEYTMKMPLGISIPQFDQKYTVLLKGDYLMKVEFVDQITMRQVGCLEAKWKVGKYAEKRQKGWFYVD